MFFYRPRSIHRRTALHVGAPPPSRTSEKKRKVVNTRPHLVDKPEQLELWVPLSFHSCFTSCRKIARSWSFLTLHIISEAQTLLQRSFLICFGCVKLRNTTRHEKVWHTKLLREINALLCKLKRSQTASSEGLEGGLEGWKRVGFFHTWGKYNEFYESYHKKYRKVSLARIRLSRSNVPCCCLARGKNKHSRPHCFVRLWELHDSHSFPVILHCKTRTFH